MSGGSLDYVYLKVEDAAASIVLEDYCEHGNRYTRKAFIKHLLLVAKVLRAIEWNMSGDGDSEETTLIEKCIGRDCALEEMVEEAKEVLNALNSKITEIEKKSKP